MQPKGSKYPNLEALGPKYCTCFLGIGCHHIWVVGRGGQNRSAVRSVQTCDVYCVLILNNKPKGSKYQYTISGPQSLDKATPLRPKYLLIIGVHGPFGQMACQRLDSMLFLRRSFDDVGPPKIGHVMFLGHCGRSWATSDQSAAKGW